MTEMTEEAFEALNPTEERATALAVGDVFMEYGGLDVHTVAVRSDWGDNVLIRTADGTELGFDSDEVLQIAKGARDRTYVVGIPLAITFAADGTISLDFDLSEATDWDEAPYGDDASLKDSATLSAALSTIKNHHALTLTTNQEAS